MFGISGGEFITLIILAMILMGPNHLPEQMRKVAVFIKKVRNFAHNASLELKQELAKENQEQIKKHAQIDPDLM